MGQNPADENLMILVTNYRDHSIIVTSHIKNRVGTHIIGAAKSFAQMVETGEISFCNDTMLFAQRLLGIRMNCPETPQRFQRDSVHHKPLGSIAPFTFASCGTYAIRDYSGMGIDTSFIMHQPIVGREMIALN